MIVLASVVINDNGIFFLMNTLSILHSCNIVVIILFYFFVFLDIFIIIRITYNRGGINFRSVGYMDLSGIVIIFILVGKITIISISIESELTGRSSVTKIYGVTILPLLHE
jgi:hypothetical protein